MERRQKKKRLQRRRKIIRNTKFDMMNVRK